MANIKVSFPFNCSCGRAGICNISEPVQINAMYLAPDCTLCGNTIVISPLKKLADAIYEYKVRICKTEREVKEKTPV